MLRLVTFLLLCRITISELNSVFFGPGSRLHLTCSQHSGFPMDCACLFFLKKSFLGSWALYILSPAYSDFLAGRVFFLQFILSFSHESYLRWRVRKEFTSFLFMEFFSSFLFSEAFEFELRWVRCRDTYFCTTACIFFKKIILAWRVKAPCFRTAASSRPLTLGYLSQLVPQWNALIVNVGFHSSSIFWHENKFGLDIQVR